MGGQVLEETVWEGDTRRLPLSADIMGKNVRQAFVFWISIKGSKDCKSNVLALHSSLLLNVSFIPNHTPFSKVQLGITVERLKYCTVIDRSSLGNMKIEFHGWHKSVTYLPYNMDKAILIENYSLHCITYIILIWIHNNVKAWHYCMIKIIALCCQ
jgi:hypothetical protein